MVRKIFNRFLFACDEQLSLHLKIYNRRMSVKLFNNKDHAQVYSQYRPTYPDAVYKTIKDFYASNKGETCNFELAVDVGCGNGQSTVPLCKLFKHVIGYDVSEEQVTAAPKDVSNLTFKIGQGEDLGFLKDNSVDLMTVAQALHWFDLDKFYSEVRRVVKPGGVFVAYGYGNNVVDKEEAQRLMEEFYADLLGPYWNKQRKHIDEHYSRIWHPFKDWKRIETEELRIRRTMTVDAYVGYLSSWSAWRTYLKSHPDSDELEKLKSKFEEVYKGSAIEVWWPVFMLIGRKESM